MGAAGFGGSFAPTVQYEKREIHPVFPHFSYFRLGQNLSPNLLAPLCGAALISLPQLPPLVFFNVSSLVVFVVVFSKVKFLLRKSEVGKSQ